MRPGVRGDRQRGDPVVKMPDVVSREKAKSGEVPAVWVLVGDPGCRLEEYGEVMMRYAVELFALVGPLKSVETPHIVYI